MIVPFLFKTNHSLHLSDKKKPDIEGIWLFMVIIDQALHRRFFTTLCTTNRQSRKAKQNRQQ